MEQKRPKTIILLIIVFLWSFGKDLEHIFRYSADTDYILFNQIGIGYLFFIFLFSLVLLDGLTVWFLWKPKPIGFWVAISSLIVGFLEIIVSFSITIKDIDVARNVYVINRQARGLPIHEEMLDMIFSSGGIYITFVVAIGVALLWAILLFWKRAYFFNKSKISESSTLPIGALVAFISLLVIISAAFLLRKQNTFEIENRESGRKEKNYSQEFPVKQSPSYPFDTIYLKNRNIIEGSIVKETDQLVTIKVTMPSGSAVLSFSKNEIAKLERGEK